MIEEKRPLVRQRDETPVADWPFGRMQRIVTGGEGGVANVSVATVNGLPPFFHTGYDEIYYIVSGEGTVRLNGEPHRLRPGSVVVIPTGVSHALEVDAGQELEIVVFGTPPMAFDDERARARRA